MLNETDADSRVRGDQCSIIRDRAALAALHGAWSDLWRRSRREYVLTTPEFAEIAARVPPDDRARQMTAVALHDRARRLVLIWPFVTYRHHGLRIAEPMASEWGDYSEVLTEDSPFAAMRVADAWAAIRRHCACDLFWLRFVRHGGRFDRALASSKGARFNMGELVACEARLADASWQDYWESRSRQERRGFEGKRRRLEKIGGLLTFDTITDPARAIPILDWLVEVKKVWLDHSGQPDRIRLRTPEFRCILHEFATVFMPQGRSELHVLRQGERLLAADINLIDKQRVEWFVGGFDPDHVKYSPGMLLKRRIVEAVNRRGLDYDMRLGSGQHKRFWQTDEVMTTSWRIANSTLGGAYVMGKRLNEMRPLRHRTERPASNGEERPSGARGESLSSGAI